MLNLFQMYSCTHK